MKTLLLCEMLCEPFDEGAKKTAFLMVKEFSKNKDFLAITRDGNDNNEVKIKQITFNKLFLSTKLLKAIKNHNPEVIYYLPEASITFLSLVRAKVLGLFSRHAGVILLAVQPRKYPWYFLPLVKLLRPRLALVFSAQHEEYLKNLNFKVKRIPLGVDTSKFKPGSKTEKDSLRDKYRISKNKFVIMHVGHLKSSRNIESLLNLQTDKNIQLLIVGSTSTEQESGLKDKFVSAGAAIIDQYIDKIEEIYQLADAYIFPVKEKTAAISFPLSVLEAMACNLPIITTRFGGLVEYFSEASDFRYYDKNDDLSDILKEVKTVKSKNREKVMRFSWCNVVKEMEAISRAVN